MGINKVFYGTNLLIDLTEDTVTAENLLEGYTAHGADGELITGTASTSSSSEPEAIDTLILTFVDSTWGTEVNFSYGYIKNNISSSEVKTIAQALQTNGSIFVRDPSDCTLQSAVVRLANGTERNINVN